MLHFAYPCPALSPHWTEQTVTASRETAATKQPSLQMEGWHEKATIASAIEAHWLQ